MSGFLNLKTVCPDPGPADECLALQEKLLELHHHRPFHTFHFLNTAGKSVFTFSSDSWEEYPLQTHRD